MPYSGAPMMDWADYVPFDAGVDGLLRDATREVAEAHFARLMSARDPRRAALAALASRHGVVLEPAAVGAWLVQVAPGQPEHLWTGLVADVALWLGDHIIARAPTLAWRLCTSHKKATGYQRPVLMGFTKVEDANYYVDVAFMVASWADLAARRRMAKPDFLQTIVDVTVTDA